MKNAALAVDARPLLPTSRLYPPRRGRGVLPRPRLESCAPKLMDHSLTLLKAPPGFGKTTLASAWVEVLAAKEIKSVWLTLEAKDSTPNHVLYCLVQAFSYAFPNKKWPSVRLCEDLPFVSFELLATQFLNDVDTLSEPLLLVVDDCHCLSDICLETVLNLLLKHHQEKLHVLLISRNALTPNVLQSLRGEPFLEMDAEDLRFQTEEIKALLQRAEIELDSADLAKLQDATAGWSTALRAYLLSSNKNIQQNRRNFHVIFDEMLDGLAPDFLKKLLPLSLLEQFSPAMLDFCFDADMTSFLYQIEQKQLFLNIKGEKGEWLSFNPIFKEYLAQRFFKQSSPEDIHQFQLRAALWLAQQKNWVAAISLALNAKASAQAEQWINHCAMDLVEQGELHTLMQWEKQLREQLSTLPSAMRLALGWASCLAMQQDKAKQLLNSLKENEGIDPWERRALQALLLAFDGRGEQAAKMAYECLPHFLNRPWISNLLVNVQRYGYMHMGNWQAFYSLPPLLSHSLSRNRFLFNKLYQHGIEAFAEIIQGRLDTAAQRLSDVIKTLEDHRSSNPMLRSLPRIILAQIYYLQGRYHEAQQQLDDSHAFLDLMGFPELIIATQGTQIKLLKRQGNYLQARKYLEEIESVGLKRLCPRLLAFALLERCRLSLAEHKHEEAQACMNFLHQLYQDQHNPPLELRYAWLLAHLALVKKNSERFADLEMDIENLAAELTYTGKHLLHIELQLALACARKEQGDTGAAASIEHWQKIAQVYGLQGLLDEYGLNIQQLVDEKAQQGGLLSLTVKERLILQEVAHGKSNKEIARNMNVAPETVKSHLKNIFAKLNVTNRTQAALFV
ncbi:MAG: hypothetical protein RL217_1441 [Pseudomonadota bacterium]